MALAAEHTTPSGAVGDHATAAGIAAWRGWDMITLVLLTATSIVMLLTLRDYGFTYDEPPHIIYGDRILEFYSNGFQLRRKLQSSSYVGGFDLIAALLRRISPFDMFVTNHVLCIFVAQCGLVGTWKLGRLLGGPLGGLCSWLVLLLIPVYYSHQFNNPKDVPFAAGYVWGLYVICKLLITHERASQAALTLLRSPKYFLQLGLALGLGMSVRVGGALLIGYWVVALAAVLLDGRLRGEALTIDWKRFALLSGAALALAWIVLLVFWPRAFASPVQGPAAAVESVSKYKAFDSPTLLRGKLVSSQHLPWDYLPTYFLVQLPEFTSGLFVAALGLSARTTWQRWRQRRPLPLSWLLLSMAALLPPAYAIVRGSTLYDGLRHFLFIMPPIAVLGGNAFARSIGELATRDRRWVYGLAALGMLFIVDQTRALVQLHPYQHVFFNRASGGTAPAVKRYETEYYGALYQELGRELAEAAWHHDPSAYLNREYVVAACGSYLFVTHNFPLNFRYAPMGKIDRADVFATYPRDRCLERKTKHPAIVEIERRGATLGVARDLSGAFAGALR